MPQIVCILRPDGSAEYVSPTWVEFSGKDLAATRAAGWPGLLHPDDLPAARECRLRMLRSKRPQEVELRCRAADGSYRWFLSASRRWSRADAWPGSAAPPERVAARAAAGRPRRVLVVDYDRDTRRVRLVALSGYAQPEDVARALEAGFDAHVAKPPDPERLALLVADPASSPAPPARSAG